MHSHLYQAWVPLTKRSQHFTKSSTTAPRSCADHSPTRIRRLLIPPYPRPLPTPPYPLFPFSYTLVCPLLTLFVPAWSAPQDARLIGGALTFQDLSIGDVMTPIDECFSL